MAHVDPRVLPAARAPTESRASLVHLDLKVLKELPEGSEHRSGVGVFVY